MKTLWLGLCVVVLGLIASAALAAPPAVEVHGWSLTRYYVDTVVDDTRDPVTGEIANKEKESHLEWERISLSGLARLPEGRTGYAEIYIHPWLPSSDPSYLYLESMYLDTPAGPGAKFRIGKGRNNAFGIVPSYGVRKTSNYSPLMETFTMDRVLGIQYLQTRGNDSVNFGILNSQRPGQRFIGMAADSQLDQGSLGRTTVGHLSNRDFPQERSGQLELDARLGHQMGGLNVGLSGRVGRLDDTDLAILTGGAKPMFSDPANLAKIRGESRRQYGLDATLKRTPYYATAEYYAGTTASMEQNGWSVLLGVEPSKECTFPWREISPACKGLFVRYTELNIGATPVLSNPVTWDTNQLAISWVLPLPWGTRPGLSPKWLQIEYERNREDVPNGGDQIPNNVFFLELFSAF